MTATKTNSAPLGKQIVMALFATHEAADGAVRKLAAAGTPLAAISIIGKNYHSEEHAAGYVNAGERAWFLGKFGAFWGGLAGMLLGAGFFYVPVVGPIVVLGPLASTLLGGIEGAVLAGGTSALVGALTALGIPKDSVVRYEAAIKAEQFLVSVHCTAAELAQTRQLLSQFGGRDVADQPQPATAAA